MATITREQFKQKYKEQHPDAEKWTYLEQDQVHTITKVTKNGESCIITLRDGRSFWACSGLHKALTNNNKLPKYIVSCGKKQSSKSANQYWSFQMIDAE